MAPDHRELIRRHQQALAAAADERSRRWWEGYLKGLIPFRGVGIPRNRELLARWRNDHGLDRWPPQDQFELALAFLREPLAEDKLAGILYLQQYLVDRVPWQTAVDRYRRIFDEQWIFDWNTCDWFCVRVLGKTIEVHGEACAEAVASWNTAEGLWRARSSVVPFVRLAAETKYHPLVMQACAVLISREERFAKTAVGWVLREISRHRQSLVVDFVDRNLLSFSRESLGNALKYFDADSNREYQRRLGGRTRAGVAHGPPNTSPGG